MKTKSLLSVIAVVVVSTSVGYAQRVVVEGTKSIIDASRINHTTVKKPTTTTGTNLTACTQNISDIGSEINNEKVYVKFEVIKTNNSETSTWRDAINLCDTLSTDGGGWRLPVLRELMLMWVLKGELEQTSGFIPFKVHAEYWAATEDTEEDAHKYSRYVSFGRGNTMTLFKTTTQSVRCVREL